MSPWIMPTLEWIGEKGVSLGLKRCHKTDWCDFSALPLRIEGLSIDEVYANFLSQIDGNIKNVSELGLRASVDMAGDIAKYEREIERLQARLCKEKQFNKQLKLNDRISDLKKKLKGLKNG